MRDDVSNMVDSQQKFSSRTQREMGETKKMVKKVEGMTRKVVFNTSLTDNIRVIVNLLPPSDDKKASRLCFQVEKKMLVMERSGGTAKI